MKGIQLLLADAIFLATKAHSVERAALMLKDKE